MAGKTAMQKSTVYSIARDLIPIDNASQFGYNYAHFDFGALVCKHYNLYAMSVQL